MCQSKIIVTGPIGAGKTTAIKSVSDIAPIKTDVDSTEGFKKQTTVAIDYGVMNLANNQKLHMYGTPGQQRFDFMWDILTIGGDGLIILLDNTRENPFQDMHYYLNAFKDFISDSNVVIGITQMDLKSEPRIRDYQNELDNSYIKPAVFSIDARIEQDVSLLVQAIFPSFKLK
ncbi:MAG: ATP/GTP-binding protein [Methylococcaceae bacterium]|nr:ATP/GTP-binding protein [Methylococcaceae bacterium]